MTEPSTMTGRPTWSSLLVGMGGGILGLLPWLLTGGRLPLQNFWDEIPTSVPFVLLPFHPYDVTLIAALLLVGSAVAGIAARALGGGRRGLWTTLAGVFVVQIVAVVQTSLAVSATLPDTTEAKIYLGGLTAGAAMTVVVGLGVMSLIARAPRAGALIGLTISAIAVQSWMAALLIGTGGAGVDYASPVLLVVPWIAPVLTGVAIAWTGLNTAGRVVAALGALVLVWVVPALMTGLVNALGSRVYWRYPAELIDYAVGVVRAALFTPELALRPIIAVVVTAAIGLAVRAVVTRRRARGMEPPAGEPSDGRALTTPAPAPDGP